MAPTRSARILLVDDDRLVARSCERALAVLGHQVTVAHSLVEARRLLHGGQVFDALLVDLDVHEPRGGLQLVPRPHPEQSGPLVYIMSGSMKPEDAFVVGRAGATDYLTRPFDFDRLSEQVLARIKVQARRDKSGVNLRIGPVIVSDSMRRTMDRAECVARTPASSALILGESGVGKEVVAAHIHHCSHRAGKPYVRVNLAAFPESMVDAELFGSVRGAFTDATRDRAGLIASADGGTLLLDELCEFRVDLQPKLLRALEERRFFPVGSDKERHVDVRVLAATNRDPHEAIASGVLRADLFYRLGAAILTVPPLRERRDDVLPLLTHFLDELATESGIPRPGVSRAIHAELLAYSWPGNVRELRNVATRMSMLAHGGEVTSEMLGLEAAFKLRGQFDVPRRADAHSEKTLSGARGEAVASIEITQIEQALAASDGSRSEAAKRLGVSRSTLWQRMKRYGIE